LPSHINIFCSTIQVDTVVLIIYTYQLPEGPHQKDKASHRERRRQIQLDIRSLVNRMEGQTQQDRWTGDACHYHPGISPLWSRSRQVQDK